ncbi:putative DNA processing protein DprA [Acetobacter nitrogenifigens DSM 23921 = NBRC 105050]|nr:DNA-processing protein DprA [Acetobacter nitrogenifigens]GBQ91530.1 putative DNA processing protein DprA [Acetobacter nitrogenifigens DSM 23921 = NBRC 105050]
MARKPRYSPPDTPHEVDLLSLVERTKRPFKNDRQIDFLRPTGASKNAGVNVFYAGELSVLNFPCVSIVGTREVSEGGFLRAHRLARQLAEAGVTVVSGLARGVDTAALTGAIKHKGRVAAVIGTPLAKAYPAENACLQEHIWQDHLLLSPFAEGEAVYRSNFPKRNRVMAAISDATVIVEASDTSGTLHQAAECQRLGRWLFIMKSVVDDPRLTWPSKFLGHEKTHILENTHDIVERIDHA